MSNDIDFKQEDFDFVPDTGMSPTPDLGMQETPTQRRSFGQGNVLNKVGDVLSIPSYYVGGVLNSRQEEGKTGVAAPWEAVTRAKAGFQGIQEARSVMEVLPQTMGIDPNSAEGMAIGFVGELATPGVPVVKLAGKIKNVSSVLKMAMNKPGGKMIQQTVEMASGDPKLAKFADEFIENIPKERALRSSQTMAGRFVNHMFGSLDKTDRNRLQGLSQSANRIAEKISPMTGFDDIKMVATKLTGYDANGLPGVLQEIKMKALMDSKGIPFDEIQNLATRAMSKPEFSSANRATKALVEKVAKLAPDKKIGMKSADALYEIKQEIASQRRAILSTASKTSDDNFTLNILNGLENEIMDAINKAALDTGMLKILKEPNVQQKLVDSFSKELGQDGAKKLVEEMALIPDEGITALNRVEYPWVLADRAIETIVNRGPRGDTLSRVVGMVAGGTAGSIMNLPGMIAGATVGATAAPVVQSATEAMVPRALSTMAAASRGIGNSGLGETPRLAGEVMSTPQAQQLMNTLIKLGIRGEQEVEEDSLPEVPPKYLYR